VLDSELNLLPIGVAGELYIGGEVGLARGYHQRPDLTAERFLPDPFGAPGERMYRTGDLVRWREDGALDYLGRVDHQVKIRGFRIELGEIESQLLALPQIAEAAVVARDTPSGKQLVGYIVGRGELDLSEIKQQLAMQLPDYMLPAQLIQLDSLPLTPARKLDRAALPEPQWQSADYQAAQTDNEQILAAIWQQVLGVERVGRTDHFFELGGDSIVALQVVSRARQQGLGLTPKDVFQQQTLAELAAVAREVSAPRAEQTPVSGPAPLLPIQARLLEREGLAACNQYLLFELGEPFEPALLEQALQALVQHHDALRLRYSHSDNGWQQWHAAPAEASAQPLLQAYQARDQADAEARCRAAQASLDLHQGPLLRALYLRQAGQLDRLLLTIHHLAVDGVSWRVLLEDLPRAYAQLQAGQAVQLAEKTTAFKAWGERLQAFGAGDVVQAQRGFWLAQEQAVFPLPTMTAAPGREDQRQRLSLRLAAEPTRELLQGAQQAYRLRADEVLLAALARVLCAWSEQPALSLHLESHGRAPLFEDIDLSRTVGWFTSLYPLNLRPAADLPGSLKAIK
jgi:non-ribosomal peptide synthetase component F